MCLPDKRLSAVLDKFTDRISQRQHLTLRKLSQDRKEEVQFGRFIRNERVTLLGLEELIYEQFRFACPTHGHLLLIEDTSQLTFSLERKITGLGKMDKGQVQGFYLHPVLGLNAGDGACCGLASITTYQRAFNQPALTRQQVKRLNYQAFFEDKESYRWYQAIATALQNCPVTVAKTVIADREADIYPLLTGLQDLGVDYIIRARHNRPVAPAGKLYQLVNTLCQQHWFSVPLPATDKRSAHTAVLKVSYGQVALKKAATKSRQPQPTAHSCWVVKVQEDACSVVNQEEPISWLLLTSHLVEKPQQALQIIAYYKQRWHIEQIFRTLKAKGLRLEASQVHTEAALKKLLLLALMAAVKVLQLIQARQGTTNQMMAVAFTLEEQQVISRLNATLQGKTNKLQNPYPPGSLAFAAWVIARLSGWSGYQSQRPPGPIDFLVGLQRFQDRCQGYWLANAP